MGRVCIPSGAGKLRPPSQGHHYIAPQLHYREHYLYYPVSTSPKPLTYEFTVHIENQFCHGTIIGLIELMPYSDGSVRFSQLQDLHWNLTDSGEPAGRSIMIRHLKDQECNKKLTMFNRAKGISPRSYEEPKKVRLQVFSYQKAH